MSGFGIRALKKVQEQESKDSKRIYYPHIVVGDDSFAAIKYLDLVDQFGEDKVQLVTKLPLTRAIIENEWKCRLNTIRSEESANTLRKKNPSLEIFEKPNESVFYKDTKFHRFSGRAKPHELMEDESFFVDKSFYYSWESLFKGGLEALDEKLGKSQQNKFIEDIELSEPTDLLEKTYFKIRTGEQEIFECEHLYYCDNPKSFYKKVSNKNLLDDSLHQFCNQLESRSSLTITYNCSGEIYHGDGTVFLPQSVTHEWGHFITDVDIYNPANNTQKLTALMFIGEDITTEEELAKKIRLMNRVVSRIFPSFAKSQVVESIKYRDDSFIKNINDDYYSLIREKHETLHFIGEGAPLSNGLENSLYLTRAILSLY